MIPFILDEKPGFNEKLDEFHKEMAVQKITDVDKTMRQTLKDIVVEKAVSEYVFGRPGVPKESSYCPEKERGKQPLKVYSDRDLILEDLERSSVLILVAHTGTGKSTQLPRILLENAAKKKEPLLVICCEPRVAAARNIAAALSDDRQEIVGQTVGCITRGYKPYTGKSNVIICTNRILLNIMQGGPKALENVTHIIIDECHEREKYMDVIIGLLKRNMAKVTKKSPLKLIMMSATAETAKFKNAFPNAKIREIIGQTHTVEEKFLEEICDEIPNLPRIGLAEAHGFGDSQAEDALENALRKPSFENLAAIIRLFEKKLIDINFKLPRSQCTITEIVACYGPLPMQLKPLLRLKPENLDDIERKAMDWKRDEMVYALRKYRSMDLESPEENDFDKYVEPVTAGRYEKMYGFKGQSECQINTDLIVAVVDHICSKSPNSDAIMIFAHGVRELEKIQKALTEKCKAINLQILLFHSKSRNLEFVSREPGDKFRKIVVSTNVGETSITIKDLGYVIDTGLHKLVYHNNKGEERLETCLISKENAEQRKGRVGRTKPGVCYRLYSKTEFEHKFPARSPPEITRTLLTEECLVAKNVNPEYDVKKFMRGGLDKPDEKLLEFSMTLLKQMGAFTSKDELTVLGSNMLKLAAENYHAKMIVLALTFGCLDPVVKVAAILECEDPFDTRRVDYYFRKLVEDSWSAISDGTYSDHYVLLKIVNEFERLRNDENPIAVKDFCSKYMLNHSVMKSILDKVEDIKNSVMTVFKITEAAYDDVKDLGRNNFCWPLIKACIVGGYYPNVAYYHRKEMAPYDRFNTRLTIPNRSVAKSGDDFDYSKGLNITFSSMCYVYEKLVIPQNKKITFMQIATTTTPTAIMLLAGPVSELNIEQDDDDNVFVSLDKIFKFVSSREILEKIIPIRYLIQMYMFQTMRQKGQETFRIIPEKIEQELKKLIT